MYYRLLLALLILSQSADLQQLSSICQNEAIQFKYENRIICDCGDNYVAQDCSIESKQINQSQQIFTTSPQLQYYHLFLNASSYYIAQLFFCPETFQPNIVYTVSVTFENNDGTIPQAINKDAYHNFTVRKQNTCFSFSGGIFTPDPKYNNKSSRVIARLKQLPSSQSLNETVQQGSFNNTMKIFAIRVEYMYPSPLVIGKYMAGLSISLLILTTIVFLVCRRMLAPTIARFQPAQRVHSINHFDELMPAVYHIDQAPQTSTNSNVQLQNQEEQCMICLLSVADSYARTTPCNHLFHRECIDEWGRKSLTCPACRSSLRPAATVNN